MMLTKEARIEIAAKNKRVRKINEILDILQEECAEVIQAVSKCRRFGIEEQNLKSGRTQREELVQELGDVTLLIELLKSHQLFTEAELHTAEANKAKKLTKWSTIYED
jgi:NTP pyrophosphatase (non-canonical NTP hydrolase)